MLLKSLQIQLTKSQLHHLDQIKFTTNYDSHYQPTRTTPMTTFQLTATTLLTPPLPTHQINSTTHQIQLKSLPPYSKTQTASFKSSQITTNRSFTKNNSYLAATTTTLLPQPQTRNANTPHFTTRSVQLTPTNIRQYPTSFHLTTMTWSLLYFTCDGFAQATMKMDSGAITTPIFTPTTHAVSTRKITIQHRTAQPSNGSGRTLHLPRYLNPPTPNWMHWATPVLRNLHHQSIVPINETRPKGTVSKSRVNYLQIKSNSN